MPKNAKVVKKSSVKTKKSKLVKTPVKTVKTSMKADSAEDKPRVLKHKRHRSLRLSKQVKYHGRELPSAAQITISSARLLWTNKKLFGGILLIYALAQIVLVQGVFRTDFSDTSAAVRDLFGDQWLGLAGGLTSFSYLLSTAGQTSTAESGVYQSLLLLIGSLAMIWALRQVLAGHVIRTRDAYYKGMYPLIPFLLVLLVISLQTIPLLIGAWLYQTVVANGIAAQFAEQAFWFVVLFLFATLTVYMICSSLFALYIVTLPDMTPIKALRSARGLVLHRRLMIVRKLMFLGLVLLFSLVIIVLPIILFIEALTPYVFYVLTVLMVGFVHAYLYSLYRELLLDE